LLRLLFFNKSFVLNQYYKKKLQKKIFNIVNKNKISFVFCSELSSMKYVCKLDKSLPIYFDDHNVEFRLIKRMSEMQNVVKKNILKKERYLIKKFEYQAIKNSFKTFVVSQVDKDFLLKNFKLNKNNIKVVNNVFMDYGGFKKDKLSDSPRLIFVGNLGWAPNKDGLLRFLKNVFPKVVERVPQVELDIIGSNLPKIIVEKSKKMPVNFLEDVSDQNKERFIGLAWTGIVPLYFASGSRIKILEFWSHGKCVVTTSMGAEGLLLSRGTFRVNSDQEFIDHLVNLLKNKKELQALGLSNYCIFKQKYLKDIVYEDTLYNSFSS
jgi:polysaccharide biosynthesis protein PslH